MATSSSRAARKLVPVLAKLSAGGAPVSAISRITGENLSTKFKALALSRALQANKSLFPLTLTALRALRPCDAISVLRWSLKAQRHNALLLEGLARSFLCLLARPPGNSVSVREMADFVDLLRLHGHRPLCALEQKVHAEISGSRWTSERFSPCDLVKLRGFFDFCGSTDAELFAKLDDRICSRLGHFGASEISAIARWEITVSPDELVGHFCRTEIPEISVLHNFVKAVTREGFSSGLSALSLVELREKISACSVTAADPKSFVKLAECYAMIDFMDPVFVNKLLQADVANFHSTDATRLLRTLLQFPTLTPQLLAFTSKLLHASAARTSDAAFAALALRSLGQAPRGVRPRGWQELAAGASEALLRLLGRKPRAQPRMPTTGTAARTSDALQRVLTHAPPFPRILGRAKSATTTTLRRVSVTALAKSRRRMQRRKHSLEFVPREIPDLQMRDLVAMEAEVATALGCHDGAGLQASRPDGAAGDRPQMKFRTEQPKMASELMRKHAGVGDVRMANTVAWRRMRRRALWAFENAGASLDQFDYVLPKPRRSRDRTLPSLEDLVETLKTLDEDFPGRVKLTRRIIDFALEELVRSGAQLERLLEAMRATEARDATMMKKIAKLLDKPEVAESFGLDGVRLLREVFGHDAVLAKLEKPLLTAALQSQRGDWIKAAPAVAAVVRDLNLSKHDGVRQFCANLERTLPEALRSEAEIRAAVHALETLGRDVTELRNTLGLIETSYLFFVL